MAIKKYKPTSASRRSMTGILYRGTLTTSEPYKPLTSGGQRHVGRNHHGRITAPHKGGGHKRLYREIDFKMNKFNIPAKVETVEYDPNRSAFIGLVCYNDGERRYMVLPQGVSVDTKIITSAEAPITPGNRLPLTNIPVGTFIYNIEIKPGNGAKMVRSAGSFAQVTAHNDGRTQLKMPSGEIRTVSEKCYASIGSVSNPDYHLVTLGKAGRSRWLGIRPTVRGSAMNPVDHPHGGGEGRQGIGLRRGPKTRYGKQAYGVRTRTPKKYSNYAIVTRRKTKRNPD
jgi:large subunit ribosomal protein L2